MTTPTPPEEMGKLLERTTAGKWFIVRDGCYADVKASLKAGSFPSAVASEIGRHNAEFIAAAHNSMPSYLDTLKEQAGRIEVLEKALQPFADLLDTDCNGYESSPDHEVVRSVGTLGRDYAAITVGDLRAARAALKAPADG